MEFVPDGEIVAVLLVGGWMEVKPGTFRAPVLVERMEPLLDLERSLIPSTALEARMLPPRWCEFITALGHRVVTDLSSIVGFLMADAGAPSAEQQS